MFLEEKKSVQLSKKLANNKTQNSPIKPETISTYREQKGLDYLNKNLAKIAKQLANQPDLNGLFLSGLIVDTVIQIAEPFGEQKLDKQAAGVSVINRLRQIVPDRFVGDSQQPFVWKDSHRGKTYQFEVEGGDLIKQEGKTRLTPKHLKAIEINSGQQIFQAFSLDHRNWHIKQCDFNSAQLSSLIKAENLLQKKEQLKAKSNNKKLKNTPYQEI